MKKEDKQLLLYGGGLLLVYFGVLRPILKKLGIQNSAADISVQQQQQLPNNQNAFSPIYWKQFPSATLLTRAGTEQLAKRIFDAMGYFSDDEAAVISVFRQLKYKTQVSWLADIFQQNYKTDLFDFLKNGKGTLWQAGLNSDELNEIINLVNKLPIKK
jgi:hypothetical protein